MKNKLTLEYEGDYSWELRLDGKVVGYVELADDLGDQKLLAIQALIEGRKIPAGSRLRKAAPAKPRKG